MGKANITAEKNIDDSKIKLSDISVLSAHDVDEKLLVDFYNDVYPARANARIWRWLNRSSFYDNKIPLVVLYNNRVIAHAGMIPFKVFLDGKYYQASWFINFSVRSEFQRCGLGTLLTEKWMEFSDLYVTFCNEKSIGVFKKFGWIEYFNTHLHYYFLMPFDHPRLAVLVPPVLGRILNTVSRPFLKIIYRKYASSIDKLRIDDLNSGLLDKFIAPSDISADTAIPVRDANYISWRLLNSPDRDRYRIFGAGGVSIVVKMNDKRYPRHIDLLWVSDSSKYSAIRYIISTLAVWGMNNNYSYIRYYTSSGELSDYLSKFLKPTVRHRRFAFYSKDNVLLNKLKHSNWQWELIDSDFEEF